jgi:hypothetical protein
MPKSPSAVEVPVKEIFSSSYLFNVPGYQRPYAWTETQAEELFDDLWEFLKANPEPDPNDTLAVDSASTYFLGSIVLIKDKDKPDATVVDGQQRLTTLTLLLACIRSTLDAGPAKSIGEFIYEPGNPFKKLPDRFRLQLRPLDAQFFKSYVQQLTPGIPQLVALNPRDKELGTDAKRNLFLNAKVLLSRTQALTVEQRVDLAMFIANRCYLVAVSTPDFGSAFRIFSVLNSRGLDLSPTDILKARLLEGVNKEAPAKVTSVTEAWEEMEVDLGRDGFFDLFTHIRAMFRKTKAKEAMLDELTVDLKKLSSLQFCEVTLPRAKAAFEAIRSADYQHNEHGKAVNVSLSWLNRLDFKDWVPPAMAFWIRHEKDGLRTLSFFQDLERLAYSMVVRRESDTARIARFGEITRAIESDSDLGSDESKLQLSPPEQWDTYEVLAGDFYLLLRSSGARKTVLMRLDSLVAGAEAVYDHPIISVEHVLPQTPPSGSDWATWFPTAELQSKWTHKVGNLALLTKSNNSAARNWAFPIKKEKYFKRKGVTTMALTVQVLGYAEWTPSIVAERHGGLVALLEKHWRLEKRMSAADWFLKII